MTPPENLPEWLNPGPSEFEIYCNLGWHLVPIPPGSKGPISKGWNKPSGSVTDPDRLPVGGNVGLAHAYSGTVAIDVDDWPKAHRWLMDRGVDLQELLGAPNAVRISSGREGRAKLLYRLPEGVDPLRSVKINDEGRCILELRCATSNGLTAQDVLPPSIHPDTGQPYCWVIPSGADLESYLSAMSPLPDSLLSVWRERIKPAPAKRRHTSTRRLPECDQVAEAHTSTRRLPQWDQVAEALFHIDPDCGRDEWIRVGMALHHAGAMSGDEMDAFHLWDEWSSQSTAKYPGDDEINAQWTSFEADTEDPVTLGTLFHIAQFYGYSGHATDADIEHFFSSLRQEDAAPVPIDEQNPLAWIGDYMMSDTEINELADPEWIFENLVIEGHVIALVAEPNGGKTTIMEWVASQMSSSHRVIYVNADISGGDSKEAFRKAREGNYELALPDMKAGKSMSGVVGNLKAMNASGGDLSHVVMIFDTLKKMVEVIQKAHAKALYATLRGLSAKGMTIIVLAHTNKYPGEDGKPVYEGTGDLRADADELIYLIPQKHADGAMTVSTSPDKIRGSFDPLTFEILTDRSVRLAESYVDTVRARKLEKQRADDEAHIDAVDSILAHGPLNQSEIIERCKPTGIRRRRVETLLKRYCAGDNPLWIRRAGPEHNANVYEWHPCRGGRDAVECVLPL